MWLVRTAWRFALLGMGCAVAHATELKQIEFKVGTEGLQFVPVTIRNSGPSAISCTAEFAHWYSSEIGEAAPGAVLAIPLWFETATGAYVMLNTRRENLPVERLWCGVAGKAFATRILLPLKREAEAAEAGQVLNCAAQSNGLMCE
jgi:hypothetical protein